MSKITIEQIKRDLETAAYIERLLPPVKPPKYRCWLFEIVYTPQELAFMDTTPLKIKPTKEQIDLWERVVLDWLEVLEPYERRLLWKRAKHIPWKFLLEEFDCGRSELWRKYSTALVKLFFLFERQKYVGNKKKYVGNKIVRDIFAKISYKNWYNRGRKCKHVPVSILNNPPNIRNSND